MTKIIIAGVVIVVLIIGIILWAGSGRKADPRDFNAPPGQPLGALSGPDIPSPYLAWGGVRTWSGYTTALNQASTTVCSLQAPVSTSTLKLGSGVRFTISSTTASTVRGYKGAKVTDVTTRLFAANIAANAQGTVVATTTDDNMLFGPNEWLNIVMSGGAGTFSPTGSCSAQFTEV